MENTSRKRIYAPYIIMLAVNMCFFVSAFIFDTPENIFEGFIKILTARSILVTDYIAVGGLGAALLNVSITGFVTVSMFIFSGAAPTGAGIMGLWLTAGFAFIGKNVFNMMPLTFGVWLYAKYQNEPFANYSLAAILVATLSPVVSEMSFLGFFNRPLEIVSGILLGVVVGFIFPPISAETLKVHSGYSLYNMGFSGGLIATIVATLFQSMDIPVIPVNLRSEGNNLVLAVLLYTISAAMLGCGMIGGIKKNFGEFIKIHRHSGRLIADFYFLHQNSVYINMAVMCIFSTTLVLVLGAQIDGPVLAGILTIV
ncbi:MAG: DUF1576 domain-containing protein, partial [Oscillospiraceae bacterium]|nr:DUF1576 domain-containing protein [Oscillospiraceae bacterium]